MRREVEKRRFDAVHSGKTRRNDTGPQIRYRIHTTVPSAFEFPASRKTFHELGSSSFEEMKDVGFGC